MADCCETSFFVGGGEGILCFVVSNLLEILSVCLAGSMDRGRVLIDSQSILLTLCATEFPVNSLDCDVALFHVCVAVIRGQVSSRDNKGKEEEIQELRTCRICKKPFQPVHNHPQACRYHTAHFGGGFGNSFFLLPWILSLVFLFLAYLLKFTKMSLNV